QVGETPFLVMEFVAGIDLHRLVRQRGSLGVGEACEYVRQAALGLQHAHERGLVHRDVKPSNLLLTARGAVVKVLDLGLGGVESTPSSDSTPLSVGERLTGTPDYMAPEQAADCHGADARADVYSLGCTLYHLLAGRPPFAGGSLAQKLAAHLYHEPPALTSLRGDLPPGLSEVLGKMMAKQPEDRYPSAAA